MYTVQMKIDTCICPIGDNPTDLYLLLIGILTGQDTLLDPLGCLTLSRIENLLNSENSNTRDLAQILVYLGNGLLVSQFYRMLHQDIKFLVILLFILF